MITPNKELAQAVTNLLQNPDFKVFLAAVSDRGEDIVKQLLTKQDLSNSDFVRGLGSGITEVLEMVHRAPADLESFKNQT